MAQRGSKGTSSLFTPLNPADVLIPGEEIRYKERKHPASLIPSFVETLAILGLAVVPLIGPGSSVLVAVLSLAAAGVLFYFISQRRWRRLTVSVALIILVLAVAQLGSVTFAMVVWLLAVLRFTYRFIMFAFYELLFITNRRLMLSRGFLGAEVDSIPLTRATDIAYRRSFWGEILGYGQVRVETAGQDQALSFIDFLNRPDTFYNILIGLSTTAVGSVRPTKAEQARAAADDA